MSLTTVDGRYQITERIASGGMGEVYRARDTVLERDVAVKVLHRPLAGDAGFIERFLREARSAALLNHPNIVAVYDWGSTDDGTYFMVMELVSGRNLRDLLASHGHLEPAQVMDVLVQTLSALSHAHEQGIVHRDIKPENILINTEGVVKVADFGLARALAESRVTQAPGTVTGTVQYLAPEQIEGEAADARTDLYALGIVGYELLVGAVPFTGETSVAIAYKHVQERVPAPALADASVPRDVDHLILHATEKDRERRPATALAMKGEAERAAIGLPPAPTLASLVGQISQIDVPLDRAPTVTIPQAKPGKSGKRAARGKREKPKRRWGRRFVTILVLLALIAGGAWAAWNFLVPRSVPNVTGMQQAVAEQTLADAGFDTSLGPEVFSSKVPRGSVVSQSIAGGDSARPHADIVLGISKGPEIVDVPTVAGESEDKAKSALTKAGLNPNIQQKFDDKVPQGDVISQSPRSGNSVNSGTKVTIVVSKGPPPVTIPTVTGLSAKDAENSLRGAGLVVDTTEHYSDKVARGDVISQSPRAGSIVDQGSKIKLDVSLGPKTFPMPDLTGLSESSALAKCKSLGLKATTSQVPGSSGSKVVGQTPGAGKTVSAGTNVTIFVGG